MLYSLRYMFKHLYWLIRSPVYITQIMVPFSKRNPAKTQIGRISKIIVQEIYESLRLALNINQWRSTNVCIKWFEVYENDDRCSFIKYDIKDFYPSITERTLDRALELAKEYMVIPLDKVEIIKHCRKTLLYYEYSVWIKKRGGWKFWRFNRSIWWRRNLWARRVCIFV